MKKVLFLMTTCLIALAMQAQTELNENGDYELKK